MVPNGLLELLVWTSLLGGLSLAKPSPGSDGLDTSTITLMNDVLSPKSEPLGIGGLKSWRKKRYIIEGRGPRKCCNLIACDSESGEFLNNDCNCTKCEAGKFPAKDGRSCVDKCPEGNSLHRVDYRVPAY
jgi:hypothetical protein